MASFIIASVAQCQSVSFACGRFAARARLKAYFFFCHSKAVLFIFVGVVSSNPPWALQKTAPCQQLSTVMPPTPHCEKNITGIPKSGQNYGFSKKVWT